MTKKITIRISAELAHVSIVDFMKEAADRKITLHYSLQDFRGDIRSARYFK